jgi:hypothetical protein
MARVQFPAVKTDLSLLHSALTDYRAQLATYTMVSVALSPEVKGPACEADHSFPSSTKVKNGGAILPFSHVFMA